MDEILTFGTQLSAELDFCVANLLVMLKGYVSAHHVEEKDAQGPHSQRVGLVSAAADPFRRCIHTSTIKISIIFVLEKGSRPKVNEFEFSRIDIDQQIFILDVSMDHSGPVTCQDGFDPVGKSVWLEIRQELYSL